MCLNGLVIHFVCIIIRFPFLYHGFPQKNKLLECECHEQGKKHTISNCFSRNSLISRYLREPIPDQLKQVVELLHLDSHFCPVPTTI